MQEERREVILTYAGCDFEADKAEFMQVVQAIEMRHLAYFISRPALFEDEQYEHLRYHFFLIYASGRVILLQAESSTLAPEIVAEVQAAFKAMFASMV